MLFTEWADRDIDTYNNIVFGHNRIHINDLFILAERLFNDYVYTKKLSDLRLMTIKKELSTINNNNNNKADIYDLNRRIVQSGFYQLANQVFVIFSALLERLELFGRKNYYNILDFIKTESDYKIRIIHKYDREILKLIFNLDKDSELEHLLKDNFYKNKDKDINHVYINIPGGIKIKIYKNDLPILFDKELLKKTQEEYLYSYSGTCKRIVLFNKYSAVSNKFSKDLIKAIKKEYSVDKINLDNYWSKIESVANLCPELMDTKFYLDIHKKNPYKCTEADRERRSYYYYKQGYSLKNINNMIENENAIAYQLDVEMENYCRHMQDIYKLRTSKDFNRYINFVDNNNRNIMDLYFNPGFNRGTRIGDYYISDINDADDLKEKIMDIILQYIKDYSIKIVDTDLSLLLHRVDIDKLIKLKY